MFRATHGPLASSSKRNGGSTSKYTIYRFVCYSCAPCNGRNVPYSHSRFMDGLVDACKVPYVYKSFSYERYVDQHSLAEHSSRCAHAPCYCYECTPPFEGSPVSLVHHLTAPSVNHYWPVVNIKYETCYPFALPELLEDHRRLLVAEEDDSVFLLAVGTSKARAGYRPVSVVCVRGNAADVDTRPLYWCVLTVTAPPAYEGDLGASITLNGTVPSCSVPGNVDMEEAWYHLPPKMVHGDSKEVQLGICITKLTVHH